jgi:hypothetical protein
MPAETPQLVPGPDGSSVPSGIRLIWMANEPNLANLSPEFLRLVQEGKALPPFFDLSSEDKKQPIPRLSVWIKVLTTIPQAWELVGANPKRCWVVFLETDKVRAISAPAVEKFPPTPCLDVHWERATVHNEKGERLPKNRAGWEGHSGIANLDKGNKTQRDSLRWQLAESATIRVLSSEEITAFRQPEVAEPKARDATNSSEKLPELPS